MRSTNSPTRSTFERTVRVHGGRPSAVHSVDGNRSSFQCPIPVTIRSATVSDGEALAALCSQMGDRVTVKELTERLQWITTRNDGMVLVAIGEAGAVVGFIHVVPHYTLTSLPQANLLVVTVDRASRSARVGTALLGAAEMWAREHKLSSIQANVDPQRLDVRRFFCDRGFSRVNEACALSKALS